MPSALVEECELRVNDDGGEKHAGNDGEEERGEDPRDTDTATVAASATIAAVAASATDVRLNVICVAFDY